MAGRRVSASALHLDLAITGPSAPKPLYVRWFIAEDFVQRLEIPAVITTGRHPLVPARNRTRPGARVGTTVTPSLIGAPGRFAWAWAARLRRPVQPGKGAFARLVAACCGQDTPARVAAAAAGARKRS